MYAVKEFDDYLTVEFDSHPSLMELETAIAEEFNHSRYASMNDIWIFNENLPDIDLDQFPEMESLILMLFPQKATHSKTALVISSGLGRAFAELWKSSTTLPYQIEVFTSLRKAKAWVAPEVCASKIPAGAAG